MRHTSTALLFLAGIVLTSTASAQVRLLPYAGYQFNAGLDVERTFTDPRPLDSEGGVVVGIGVELPFSFGPLPFALAVRPSAETALVSGATDTFEEGESVEISQRFFQVSVDAVADFSIPGAPVAPFVGFGLGYTRYSADFDTSANAAVEGDSNVSAWALGPNVLGGLRFGGSRATPFVQARYSFTNPSPDFSGEASGSEIGNGFSVLAGVGITL